MKINQFGYVPTPHQQIIDELRDIRFLDLENINIKSPLHLFRSLLLKSFSVHQGETTRITKIASMMATETVDADSYTNGSGTLSKSAFYNVGLQLLGFTVDLDFSLTNPLKMMTEVGLPIAEVTDPLTRDDVIDAWYRLLNTRTKFGQLLIDKLAGEGYYHQFLADETFKRPLIFNGKAQAVFDTDHLVREVVYVESPLDTDHDGRRDLLKVKLIRPAETDRGLTVPVVYTANPYGEGTNDKWSESWSHDNNRPLKRKQPNNFTYRDVQDTYDHSKVPVPRTINGHTKQAEETFTMTWTYSLNDYFLARGFAVVYSAGIGTKDSDGFRTTGTRDETISAISVIEWLHGDRTAFTNRVDQIAIPAWWATGNVGMTGRSYLGTLSIASELTGVGGLKTAVVEAGISNYYDYYRENGLMVSPDGDDADVLAEFTFSRQQSAADYAKIKKQWLAHLKQIKRDQDHDSGSYNRFWDARNLLKENHAKADILLVHGLNDGNVKPAQVWNLRKALKSKSLTQKLILHQGQHEYLNNFRSFDFTDIVNLWLTNKLLNVANQANQVLPNVIVQDNAHAETWHGYQDWGGQEASDQIYQLGGDQMINPGGHTSFSDHLDKSQFETYTKDINKWRDDLYSRDGSPMDGHCIRILTRPLVNDLVVDGRPSLTLTVKSSQAVGMISVALMDYGKANRLTADPKVLASQQILTGYHWRKDDLKEFLPKKKANDVKRVVQGHINMQNRENAYKVDDLKPNNEYQLNLVLQPTFWRFLKGHQIGVVIYATDMAYTVRGNQDIRYQVNLASSTLRLPELK
ncbi:MAG: Xaa-Pro dipeptidyl-peptidase [Lentilactobacillus diolivorans]|uniref:Xaa-Pro dipeptidyl-peptidase n=1 Tax=Lentilactobacillus diolivorans TaxID=179838 RepID=UPI0039ECD1A0